MQYKHTTQVPNSVFDHHLKTLSHKELKVLLIVVRNTLGWVDGKGIRKKRDWISQKYFHQKTGLSRKSVSEGLKLLIMKKLIIATNIDGKTLSWPSQRKGQMRIFYSCSQGLIKKVPQPCVISSPKPITKGNNTKLNSTKREDALKKLSDVERIIQILSSLK